MDRIRNLRLKALLIPLLCSAPLWATRVDLDGNESGADTCEGTLSFGVTPFGAFGTWIDFVPFPGSGSSGRLFFGRGFTSCFPFNGDLSYVADLYIADVGPGDTITLEVNNPNATWGTWNFDFEAGSLAAGDGIHCPGEGGAIGVRTVFFASCTNFSNGTTFYSPAFPERVVFYTSPGGLQLISKNGKVLYGTSLLITDSQFVSQQPATLNMDYMDVTYRATLINFGELLGTVAATVASSNPYSVRTLTGQDTLSFGPVPANGQVVSTNTFTVLVNRTATQPFDFSMLQLTFQTTPTPPVANAGPPQTVLVGSTVRLDG